MWIAFLDSSVLFSVFNSNLILFLSQTELFSVRWSQDVHQEWVDARMERFPDSDRAALERKRNRMDEVFTNAVVSGYEGMIQDFDLPDANDRHIAAAADRAHANVIVTENIVDFPTDKLRGGLFAQTPDDFIANQFHLTGGSARLVAIAIIRHKKSLTTSRPRWGQYYAQLEMRLPATFGLASEPGFRALIVELLRSGEWRF